MKRILISLGLIGACIGLDQVTKRLASASLKGHPAVWMFDRIVEFTYAENTGAWGSLGAGWPPVLKVLVFVVLPLGVLVSIGAHMVRSPELDAWRLVAFALVVGGGIGNIIDRIATGYVVDFLYVGFRGIGTNIFNVADVAVVAGVIMLLLPGKKHEERTAAA